MTRSTMTSLIAKTRLLINDRAELPQFSDEDIQMILDSGRVRYNHAPLQPAPAFTTGRVYYYEWHAPVGDWEDTLAFQDYKDGALTPSESSLGDGVFTFALTQEIVYMSGWTYDCYRAAAELLQMWAAALSEEMDFSQGDQSFKASQLFDHKLALAQKYLGQARSPSHGELTGDWVMPEPRNVWF